MAEELGTSSERATILIADDFPQWRAQVREILVPCPEWQIVGEACDGFEAVRKASELCPDLVLLDIGMPGMNGIQAAERIRDASRATRIVFLSQDNDIELKSAALNTGADGYVLKVNAATELLYAVATALRNGHRRN